MIQDVIIKRIADLIIQNLGKEKTAGLYNGKAGLALTLLMTAKYLNDEHIGEIAYHLLKESLVIQTNDISFENGLSGIGYVLLYLIEKEYMEADIEDIFGTQYEEIIRSFDNIDNYPDKLIKYLSTVYFLTKFGHIKKEDKRIQEVIKKIFVRIERFLTVQFEHLSDINYLNNKLTILHIFNDYLKLIDYSCTYHVSASLLGIYTSLYQKGRIMSSLEMGYYLRKISIRNQIVKYDDLIHENILNGIKNIPLDMLSLRERIDLAKIISDLNYKDIQEHRLIHEIDHLYKDRRLQDLFVTTPEMFSPMGYGAGLARLLIYCVDNQAELL